MNTLLIILSLALATPVLAGKHDAFVRAFKLLRPSAHHATKRLSHKQIKVIKELSLMELKTLRALDLNDIRTIKRLPKRKIDAVRHSKED